MAASDIEIEVGGERIQCRREDLSRFKFFEQYLDNIGADEPSDPFVLPPNTLSQAEFLAVLQLSDLYNNNPAAINRALIVQQGYNVSRLVTVADYLGHAELTEQLAALILQHLTALTPQEVAAIATGAAIPQAAPAVPVDVAVEHFMPLVIAIEDSGLVPGSAVRGAMEHLGFRGVASVERNTELQVHGVAGGGPTETYLALPLSAAALEGMKLEAVEFRVSSHDQGWSNNRAHHGTTEGSYTWGSCRVVDSANGQKLSAESDEEVYRNLHAVDETQQHIRQFDDSSHVVQAINAALAAGKNADVQLLVSAYYPGWENHVESATITSYWKRRV